ncbi:MAG: hypothetical protein KBT36_02475 [Kurthia sp.]|nr:hypothetical protein [Candidatus Kurthia equi]
MVEQRATKKKKQVGKWLIILGLICCIVFVSALTLFKANEPTTTSSAKVENRGSYLIAEQGLEGFRQQLDAYTIAYYKQMMTRYEKLSPTDRAAFDVESIVTAHIQKYLLDQSEKSQVVSSYELVKGIQPTSTTTVVPMENSLEFLVQSTGTIGGDKTQLQQVLRVDLEIPKTMVKDKYSVQYAVHAANKIVIQNASNILGLLANADPRQTTIDGSSCQHEFSGNAYLNKCLNDGNTSASSLKIINGQSFKKFLPSFPTKEISNIEDADYNDEDLYFVKKVKVEGSKKKKKVKVHYLKDSVLTIDTETLKTFKQDKAFSFTSSEERLEELSIDGVEAYINIGDGVQTLRIDELSLTGNAKLHFIGNGNVKLFIKSFASTEGQIIADSVDLSTYYDGEGSLNLSPNFTSSGFIYVKNADLSLMMDTYEGNIISGGSRVVINGGASPTAQLILAPKASLELTNRTNFKGAIIAHSAVINQSTVTFTQPTKSMQFPIEYPQYGDATQYILYSKPVKY